ncbi:MAG: 4Fe-4S binding protein, partial [Chloroflexota bacterium]|nr:4Fe-4S binding protein [Chloroflexota bacterium]
MPKQQGKRQSIRKALLVVSFLLFPITINYFSPYIIIDGASQGIVNGSLIVFGLMFLSALFLGRLWCGWVCPAGGLQELTFRLNNRRARGGRSDCIKWAIWLPWVAIIAILVASAGGYRRVDPFYLTDSKISVTRPENLVILLIVV